MSSFLSYNDQKAQQTSCTRNYFNYILQLMSKQNNK